MRRAALVAAGLWLWLAAATAEASNVRVREGTVMFVGAPGEANAVTVADVEVLGGHGMRVRDTGTELFAGYRCETLSVNEAICRNGPLANYADFLLAADLRDGDDSIRIESSSFEPIPGLRVEEGLDGPAVLRGGSGNDVIVGGDEVDEVDGGLGTDHIDGGGGPNDLSYRGRTQSLMIDLKRGVGGEAGENDTITHMENTEGGSGNDTMIGACGSDGYGGFLSGGPGNDHLIGSRCDEDSLYGQRGNDLIEGRRGDDTVIGDNDCSSHRPRGPANDDTLVGGPGDDLVCDSFGRNFLVGGAGDDRLSGGRDRDDFAAGPGHDRVEARDAISESVSCGQGPDTAELNQSDRPRGCEHRTLKAATARWTP